MSQSINAAKKRRALSQPVQAFTPNRAPQQMQTQAPPQPQPAGLTLPQVISLIDTRLVTLEKFMNETKSNPTPASSVEATTAPLPAASDFVSADDFAEGMVEFDNRFQLLATEIANIKDIVLALQKYTMDVNKTLVEKHLTQVSSSPVVDHFSADSSSPVVDHFSADGQNIQMIIPPEA